MTSHKQICGILKQKFLDKHCKRCFYYSRDGERYAKHYKKRLCEKRRAYLLTKGNDLQYGELIKFIRGKRHIKNFGGKGPFIPANFDVDNVIGGRSFPNNSVDDSIAIENNNNLSLVPKSESTEFVLKFLEEQQVACRNNSLGCAVNLSTSTKTNITSEGSEMDCSTADFAENKMSETQMKKVSFNDTSASVHISCSAFSTVRISKSALGSLLGKVMNLKNDASRQKRSANDDLAKVQKCIEIQSYDVIFIPEVLMVGFSSPFGDLKLCTENPTGIQIINNILAKDAFYIDDADMILKERFVRTCSYDESVSCFNLLYQSYNILYINLYIRKI